MELRELVKREALIINVSVMIWVEVRSWKLELRARSPDRVALGPSCIEAMRLSKLLYFSCIEARILLAVA